MTSALTVLLFAPRNICVAILRGYRAAISPLYGDVCRYYPSCSGYALGAIQQHGVISGIARGGWRLLRCHPWAAGGIEDVPVPRGGLRRTTPFGFVIAGRVSADEQQLFELRHREGVHA